MHEQVGDQIHLLMFFLNLPKEVIMKRTLLFCLALLSGLCAYSQVKNYCIRLTSGGSVDCGQMSELDEASSFTLQFWMNADSWKSGAMLFSRGEGLKVEQAAAKTLDITLGTKKVSVNADDLVSGKWAQVTILCDKGSVKVFVNKKQVKTATGVVLPTDDAPFLIGGGDYAGRIDEVRVWSAALSSEYDYFFNNTLNKWVPQIDNLVAYFKMDQELCPNLVDYKALFVPSAYNHHGVFSASGVQREEVKDNAGLPYLLCGAYTNNARFFDRGVNQDQYLLANDIIMLGIQSYSDGHLKYLSPNDHATVTRGEYLGEYEGRSGVLSLGGDGSMECPGDVFDPPLDANGKATTGYTFETWLYLEKWTDGGYIFRRETPDGKHGFSIRLGDEEKKHVIVRVNGNEFVNINSMPVGEWVHFAVTANAGGTVRTTFMFTYNGKDKWANATQSGTSTDYTPTGMGNEKAYIGEGLTAKFDNTVLWIQRFDLTALAGHMNVIPMPAIGKEVTADLMRNGMAFYTFDRADNMGWDSYSQDEWRDIIRSAYEGYRGYQLRISVQGHTGWQTTIANANRRKIFAQDLAALSEGYDGVELDLEWMDGTQTNLGLLADEIVKVLPEGKVFMISHHQYGAYQFPKDKIAEVDGFTFQQYGPQMSWFNYNTFVSGANAFVNYGYPKNKIYLSYSTTTSGAYNASGAQISNVITGVRNGLLDGNYTPDPNGAYEKAEYNGNYYYLQGPRQVYLRAKYCVDNQMQGIFYWDMGNDVKPTHKYSLAKACNYALSSNVDSLVTEVTVNHPTGIRDIQQGRKPQAALNTVYDLSGCRHDADANLPRGVYIRGGRKILK